MTTEQKDILSTELVVELDKYIFQSQDNEFCIFRALNKEVGIVTAVGYAPSFPAETTLRLSGNWENSPKYGPQFSFQVYSVVIPSSITGLKKYLASGIIPGIGPSWASKIVDAFGLETPVVIDKNPERLYEIEGMGEKRVAKIVEAWKGQKTVEELMIFLQGCNVSLSLASKIYRAYGKDSIVKIRSNPYVLTELHGIGFTRADEVALKTGVPLDSPNRIQAGILYILSQASGDGHCFLMKDALMKKSAEMLGLTETVVENNLIGLEMNKTIIFEGEIGSQRVYQISLYQAEVALAARIKKLLSTPSKFPDIPIHKAIEWAQYDMKMQFDPGQKKALETILLSNFSLLSGGPGTGKTTIMRALTRIFDVQAQKGRPVKLVFCSPTGRAAKRLAEVTGREATTIHRLLEWDFKTKGFKHDQTNPIEGDLIIVDETSMLDISLANSLFKAISPYTAVLLVGDPDQLPSVGPGNVLSDLIKSGAVPVSRLSRIFRQGEGSLISINAHRINNGQPLDLMNDYKGMKDFYVFYRETPEEIMQEVLSLCRDRLPNKFGFKPSDIMVITPVHRGDIGTHKMNSALQQVLNPNGKPLPRGGNNMRVGDTVSQRSNNYDLDVFNGEKGIICGFDEENRTASVNYDGRIVEYDLDSNFDEVMLSYASTVHRAQGGEAPCVVFLLHTQFYVMLNKRIAYTAVTRGKKLVIVVASKKAISMAIKNKKAMDRNTSLSERIAPISIEAALTR